MIINRLLNMNSDHNNYSNNLERYAYCLCLHVRPATIFIALVNLGAALICAIMTLVMVSYGDSSASYSWQSMSESQRSTAISLAIVVYMLMASVSAMMFYGVLKSRSTYILPFFGIQFIDFLFTLPHFLTTLYANPNTWESRHATSVQSGSFFDIKHVLPSSPANQNYQSTSLLFATLIVILKTYFLCVVWKCYRYLRMKELVLPLHLPYHASVNASDLMVPSILIPPSIGTNLAPPGYDEATKNCAPPDYEAATRNDEFKFVPNTPPSLQVGHTSSEASEPQPQSSCSTSSSMEENISGEVSGASSPVQPNQDVDVDVNHGQPQSLSHPDVIHGENRV